MPLMEKIQAFVNQVGIDTGIGQSETGKISDLTTTAKIDLVRALNGIREEFILAEASIPLIEDETVAKTSLYSSQKITALIEKTKNDIVAEAPEAFDTLKEIADLLAANDEELRILTTAISQKVRYDASQSISDSEKITACTNIGVGNVMRNFEDIYLIASDVNTFVDPGFVRPGFVS